MILFGTPLANEITSSLKQEVSSLCHTHRPPKLSVLLVGEHRASHIYVSMKQKSCSHIGILSETITFPESVSEKELLQTINQLNEDATVDGILIQLPLPPSIDSQKILFSISPKKDVDGFHPLNMGKLLLGHTDGFIPCTPLGIQKLLRYYNIPTEGKHIVIVGRSNIVGKPLAALLMQKHQEANATVTLCHSMSRDLEEYTKRADILIVACGISKCITEAMVKKNAYIIDVGVHHIQDIHGKTHLTGDVDFENVREKVAGITPVPKGVGPMTVAMLLYNTIKSYKCNIY